MSGDAALSLAKFLAVRMREIRVAMGLTQYGLAKRAGVTVETVARIERVVREASSANPNPSLDTLARIAGALGVAVVELLAEPRSPRPKDDEFGVVLRAASPATRRRLQQIAEVLVRDQFEAPEGEAK